MEIRKYFDSEYVGKYLHEHIPLTQAMAVKVLEVGKDGVIVSAPLSPNINHRETVFGGSASSLAILSAWVYVHFNLCYAGLQARVVIHRNTMVYEKPIQSLFTATCRKPENQTWDHFMTMLKRKNKARISLNVFLESHKMQVGKMKGEFVALGLHKS